MPSNNDISEIRNWWHHRSVAVQNNWRRFVEKERKKYRTTRFYITVLLFFAAFFCYMLRVYFSVVLVVISKDVAATVYTRPSCQKKNKFWTKLTSSLAYSKKKFYAGRRLGHYEETAVVSVFHLGFCISHFIADEVVHLLGPTSVVSITFMITGMLTFGVSYCSHYFVAGLYVIRFVTGFLTGFLVESFYRIILSWAPITERREFFDKYFGFHLGTAFTYIFCGIFLLNFKWQFIPFFTATFSMIFGMIWATYVTDNPEDHLFISDDEVDFIRMRLDLDAIQWFHHSSSRIKRRFPVMQVLKSRAIWAVFLSFWTHYWNYFFYLDYLPVYSFEILKIGLIHTNFILGAMYLTRLAVGLLAVYCAEKFISYYGSRYVSYTRKFLTFLSHVVPGVLLILSAMSKCHLEENFWLVMTALVLNGTFMGGALLNMSDLAPRFDTQLTEILHNVCNIVGFIVVCSYRVVNVLMPNLIDRWTVMFILNGSMFLVGGMIFIILGSAEIQVWDSPREHFENLRVEESFIL